jgi:hypothetical protein
VVAPGGLRSNRKENSGVCFVSSLPKQSGSPVDAQRNDRISYLAIDTGAPIPLQGLRSSLLFPDFSNQRDSFQECRVALILQGNQDFGCKSAAELTFLYHREMRGSTGPSTGVTFSSVVPWAMRPRGANLPDAIPPDSMVDVTNDIQIPSIVTNPSDQS